ncbi:MAG: glycoside hydrolase family 31 protein [Prolixibacteraceae bacterium]|jgi:alpha-glucosidase|nr:glycoside hydrolase family 31 protein [Prolixibacteraceae bacterium]
MTKKFWLLFITIFVLTTNMYAQTSVEDNVIKLASDEKLWFGCIAEGHKMPLSGDYRFNFYANNRANQLQPLIISNRGLYVWSEEPYSFDIRDGRLLITDPYKKVKAGRKGNTLAEVQQFVCKTFFPPTGNTPDTLLFARPQYNTWIELNYNQNQADILKYARDIIGNGLPAGVLMIDDTWQEDYGVWEFHPGRFPDPKGMMDELHRLGFKVMLWICPFVSPDQMVYRELTKEKAFLLEKKKETDTWSTAYEPSMIRWWNGVSAELDFSNPKAVNWFNAQMDSLVKKYGIDGFKFDAADMEYYPDHALTKKSNTPNENCRLYTQFGLRFPLNEYRACWKMGGQPLAQRLLDKNHDWEDLQKLIPHMVAEGLSGYFYSCPDMIGGGLLSSFENVASVDQELVVRSAQCHALMPMMQFSVAPWRILDEEHLNAVKKSVSIRMRFTPLILKLATESARTGVPVVTNLEYRFPAQGLEMINDQFMLGDNLMIAPMVRSGNTREVVLPEGKWKSDDGVIYDGGKTYTIRVSLDRLPYFELADN